MADREKYSINILELDAYSKNALPSVTGTNPNSVILVTDKGVGDDEVAICVNDGTAWIDIVTNAAVA